MKKHHSLTRALGQPLGLHGLGLGPPVAFAQGIPGPPKASQVGTIPRGQARVKIPIWRLKAPKKHFYPYIGGPVWTMQVSSSVFTSSPPLRRTSLHIL